MWVLKPHAHGPWEGAARASMMTGEHWPKVASCSGSFEARHCTCIWANTRRTDKMHTRAGHLLNLLCNYRSGVLGHVLSLQGNCLGSNYAHGHLKVHLRQRSGPATGLDDGGFQAASRIWIHLIHMLRLSKHLLPGQQRLLLKKSLATSRGALTAGQHHIT